MDYSDRYTYNAETVNRVAPTQPGIYRLIYRDATDGNFYVFYVGQSIDLEARLLDHLQPSEPNACIRGKLRGYTCFFRYALVASQAERDRLERQEIKQFNPDCNRT